MKTFVTLCVLGIQLGYVAFSAILLWKGESGGGASWLWKEASGDGAEEHGIEVLGHDRTRKEDKGGDDGHGDDGGDDDDNVIMQMNPTALAVTPVASLGHKKTRGFRI